MSSSATAKLFVHHLVVSVRRERTDNISMTGIERTVMPKICAILIGVNIAAVFSFPLPVIEGSVSTLGIAS